MKIWGIAILYLATQLFSQEVSPSSSSITTEQDLLPFEFKFHYVPKLYESPSLEYDEIVIPYQRYVQPEVIKQNVNDDILKPDLPRNLRRIKFDAGQGIDFLTEFGLHTLKSTLGFSLSYNSCNVIDKTEQKSYTRYLFDTKLENIVNNTTVSLDTKFRNFHLWTPLYLLSLNGMLKSIIFANGDISYIPEIFCLIRDDTNKFWSSNSIINNIFLTEKVLIFSGIKHFYLDGVQYKFITGGVKTKKLFLDNTLQALLDFDLDNYKSYYSVELKHRILSYVLSLKFKKEIYYKYINEYFSQMPGLTLDKDDKLYYPDIFLTDLNIEYDNKTLYLAAQFTNFKYKKFPTYIYEDNSVKSCFINDVDFNRITLISKLEYLSLKNQFRLIYSLPSKDVYFIPKLTLETIFDKNITNKLQVEQKFVYNDDLQINTEQKINPWLTSTTILSYKISDNIFCSISYFTTLINRYYLQPDVYIPSFLQFGLQAKF